MNLTKLDLSSLLRATPPLEVKFTTDGLDAGQLVGWASLFNGEPDSFGDIVAPGAFATSLKRHKAEGTLPAMLWSHDPAEPIGKWLEIVEDAKGLAVQGQLNLDSDRGRQAHAHLKAGDIDGLSIGYRVMPGGRTLNDDGTSTLTAVELLEVSAVAMPALRRARITAVKSIGDVERILRDNGLPRGAASKIAAGGWPALLRGDEAPEQIDQLARAVEEATRKLKGFCK